MGNAIWRIGAGACRQRHSAATIGCQALRIVCIPALVTREPAVERLLFTISPRYNGWQVRDELRDRDWFAELEPAVASASTLAQLRHALTGHCTGVLVQLGDDEAVLRVRHG